MEYINRNIFLLINAPEHPSTLLLTIAIFFAEYAIWVIPIIIGIGWLRCSENIRKVLLEATVSGLVGLLINQIIGLVWQHPRPFMIDLGHTLIQHVPDSSFPSDHLTLLWTVAFSFLMHRSSRLAGLAITLLGVPVAWARIYLGVHFPFDMLGAVLVAVLSARLTFREIRMYMPRIYSLSLSVHRIIFRKFIQVGWVCE